MACITIRVEDFSDFANVLQDALITFPPAGVIDVGSLEIEDGLLLKPTLAGGAGIYGCDTHSVLKTLARACVKKEALSDVDRQWILARSTAIA